MAPLASLLVGFFTFVDKNGTFVERMLFLSAIALHLYYTKQQNNDTRNVQHLVRHFY